LGGTSQCSFEEGLFVWEEILTRAVARHRKVPAWAKLEKGKERKFNM